MSYIRAEDWEPSGIDWLEPAALDAVKSDRSTFVMAGPGAGKTELLAQRAAFLFQTGICPAPARILAISFKRDAAKNLADRVRSRCSEDDAKRFSSLTFDAFAKGVVDRFGASLPTQWRPRNYEIRKWKDADREEFLSSLRYPMQYANADWQGGPKARAFESEHLGVHRLPIERSQAHNQSEFAVAIWWARHYLNRQSQSVSFTMLNRLAEATQRLNPGVQEAIRATFPFVFVDEFQDTTYAQFDLIRSIFANALICLTVVGDKRQRIMVWAGARVDAFEEFERSFGAVREDLKYNWRSSRALVRIHEVVSNEIDDSHVPVEARRVPAINSDQAQMWLFSSRRDESARISTWIANDIKTRYTSPNDYAVLVRQKPGDFEGELRRVFRPLGIRIRNEGQEFCGISRQDLVSSALSGMILPIFKLVVRGRDLQSWNSAIRSMCRLHTIEFDHELAVRKVQGELSIFLREWYEKVRNSTPTAQRAELVTDAIFAFLGMDRIMRSFSEYRGVGTLDLYREAICSYFRRCAESSASWGAAIDEYEGTDSMRLLTMHKSKGLEYDTVVIQGLDDSTWWSYDPDNPEGMCTLFVALSRAKERVILTHCSSRGGLTGVSDLYNVLVRAGVPVTDYRDESDRVLGRTPGAGSTNL